MTFSPKPFKVYCNCVFQLRKLFPTDWPSVSDIKMDFVIDIIVLCSNVCSSLIFNTLMKMSFKKIFVCLSVKISPMKLHIGLRIILAILSYTSVFCPPCPRCYIVSQSLSYFLIKNILVGIHHMIVFFCQAILYQTVIIVTLVYDKYIESQQVMRDDTIKIL